MKKCPLIFIIYIPLLLCVNIMALVNQIIRDEISKYFLPILPEHPKIGKWTYCIDRKAYYFTFMDDKWYYDIIHDIYISYQFHEDIGEFMNISKDGCFWYEYWMAIWYNGRAYNDVSDVVYKEWTITFISVSTIEDYLELCKLDKSPKKFDKSFEKYTKCPHCGNIVDKYLEDTKNYHYSRFRFQHLDCYEAALERIKNENYMSESYIRSRKYNRDFSDDDDDIIEYDRYSNAHYFDEESDNEDHHYGVRIDVPNENNFDEKMYLCYSHSIKKIQRKFNTIRNLDALKLHSIDWMQY